MVTVTESKPIADVVNITQSTAIRWPNEQTWPTPGQFKQLSILLKAKYPALTEGIDRGSEFKHGFLFLMYAGRRAAPDTGRSLSYWTQVCDDWLQKYGIGGRTNADALLASAICHGIPWSGPSYGKIGITLGESSEPLPSAFRKVLESGLPDPVPGRPLDHSIGTSNTYSVGDR
jgi:hypothetical protein